ncbi:HET-domain-containing protein [Macroventuria anomochaeta]|uniref:HET-domain-containing protein n=1 Tax=Macroventuria anomochaeta TaxID=301207 RepID=A0ACB6SJA0_9PLEO|nr:HET-domain-containing protein [Macroventuria anomochaeta]KAF2633519.1 HET-domain-containing protein [Macroventuria anomochaeta]
MRLLKRSPGGGFELITLNDAHPPPYAILSHTWTEGQEVTYNELVTGAGKDKAGYAKICFCGEQAAADGLEYFWVDTCCIDKSSSAELSESVNSMYQWYMNAAVCYVFLADLPSQSLIESGFQYCRWFTRGWTLQELLAPTVVKLYDMEWNFIGTKVDFAKTICNATGIPVQLLLGHTALSDTSIAMRMSWAAHRQTTRIEDIAYCLLGIFEVNMPLIYGEGMRAFRRLQEEIIKRNNDLTIFAWDILPGFKQQFVGLFAPSPIAFSGSSGIVPFSDDFANFSVTNRGLFLTGDIPLRVAEAATEGGRNENLYLIFLGTTLDASVPDEDTSRIDGGIYLRKIGPRLFCREGLLRLAGFRARVEQVGIYEVTESYILLDPTTDTINASWSFRNLAIHIPVHEKIRLEEAIPETLWDHTDRMFVRPKRYYWATYPTVLAMRFNVTVSDTIISLVVLCDYRKQVPILKMFTPIEYIQESTIIFQRRYREETISWEELEIQAPGIHALNESAIVKVGNSLHHISVYLEKGIVEHISGEVEVLSLSFAFGRNRSFPLE